MKFSQLQDERTRCNEYISELQSVWQSESRGAGTGHANWRSGENSSFKCDCQDGFSVNKTWERNRERSVARNPRIMEREVCQTPRRGNTVTKWGTLLTRKEELWGAPSSYQEWDGGMHLTNPIISLQDWCWPIFSSQLFSILTIPSYRKSYCVLRRPMHGKET